jgi:predicted XRE-type DNA-binding protein
MINKILKKIYYEKYTNKSYSISNVDLIINRMFSKIKNGIYVDVGCNHPIKYNNTYLLYKRGWRGINIDLDKKSIDEFNLIRNKDYNIQALISSEENINKEIYFYHERSAINTVSKDLIDYRNSKNEDFQIKKQLTSTLNKIIEDSPFKDKKINLISIDIEDHEYEALKNFNFNKYKIDCIVSEIHDYNQEKLEIYNQTLDFVINSKIYKLLEQNDYKLINWVNSDFVFVNKQNDL